MGLTLVIPPTPDSSSVPSSLTHPIPSHHSSSHPSPTAVPSSVVAAVVSSLTLAKLTSSTKVSTTRASNSPVTSTPSTLVVTSATTSTTTSTRLVISSTSTKAVPSVAGHSERFFVQFLLGLPVIPHHLPLASLKGLAADVVEEALLFVIKNFFLFITVLYFTLFATLHNLDIDVFSVLFLGYSGHGHLS